MRKMKSYITQSWGVKPCLTRATFLSPAGEYCVLKRKRTGYLLPRGASTECELISEGLKILSGHGWAEHTRGCAACGQDLIVV